MKALVSLSAALMIILGLTGLFWPDGLMDLAKYSFTGSGAYVIAAIRVLLGAFLFTGAVATRTPKTVRVIGAIIFTVGIVGVLLSHEPAQRLSEWWVAKGPDAFRIAACLPLAVGFFIAGSAVFNNRHAPSR
jgi:protein-S-isoprenylcysteine O-methyltransferase Ste14